jgi:hypothetical protein
VDSSLYFSLLAHPSPLKWVGVGVHTRHIRTPQFSQITSFGASKPSATSVMASHLSHLNSYIGIYEPLKCGVAIPIAFLNALLPISYPADSAFSVFHLVIATLVAPTYFIFSINHSIYWIK